VFLLLGGEILSLAQPLLERNFHPTVIVSGYLKALQKALDTVKSICHTIDVNNDVQLQEIVLAAVGTKFSSRWGLKMVDIAINAVRKVVVQRGEYKEVDIKRYVRIEKIPGGELSECIVMDGVMFNKDVTHSKMRRRIENPRILLLDCPLEYKKGESQTNVEITNEEDFNALLRQEEEYIEQICAQVTSQYLIHHTVNKDNNRTFSSRLLTIFSLSPLFLPSPHFRFRSSLQNLTSLSQRKVCLTWPSTT